MLDWLREKRQTQIAIDRFWRQVLVSAINEDLDYMAAAHGFQVFWLGFLARADSYEMGVPALPLAELYGADAWRRLERVSIHLRSPVETVDLSGSVTIAGQAASKADLWLSACRRSGCPVLAPDLGIDTGWVEYSPITGIHLWFDRPITSLPHATLLDRTIQWMFNKSEGRYIQLVVSASRELSAMPKGEVIALALSELQEFFPAAAGAKLERSHVIKELRATFSARPGVEGFRPGATTHWAKCVSCRGLDNAPDGRPPWRGRCAVGISRPRRSAKLPDSRSGSWFPISGRMKVCERQFCSRSP